MFIILLQISKGQFVVVKYLNEKKFIKKAPVVLYVGQICEKFSNKFQVKFLVGYKGSVCKFVFPNVDDYDFVKLSSIVRVFPDPQIHRRIHNFSMACI